MSCLGTFDRRIGGHVLVLALLLFTARTGICQPDTLWSYTASTTSAGYYTAATEMADGSILLCGVVGINVSNGRDMLLTKLSPSGDHVWSTVVEGDEFDLNDEARAAVELPDGQIRLIGWITQQYAEVAVIDVSADGTVGSNWQYGVATGSCKAYDGTITEDGNILISGYCWGGTSSDFWAAKKSPSSNPVWMQTYPANGTDIAFKARAALSGGYIIGGQRSNSSLGGLDARLVRTDDLGVLQWDYEYGTENNESAYDVIENVFGEIYLICRRATPFGDHGFIAKTDANGGLIWQNTYTTGYAQDSLRAAVETCDGGLLCAGSSGESADESLFWLLRVSPSGDSVWSWNYGPLRSGFLGMAKLSGGGAIACGWTAVENQIRGYALKLRGDRGLSGRVYSQVTGEPLAGIVVEAIGATCRSRTRADGLFSMELEPGSYALRFSGVCVTTDTLENVIVEADTVLEYEMSLPEPQLGTLPTSLNLIGHNQVNSDELYWLRNHGTGALTFWSSAESIHPATDWLHVSPETATIPAGDSLALVITVSPDTTNDGVFEYYGQMRIRSNSCPDTNQTVPIFLTVLDAESPEFVATDFKFHAAYPNPFNAGATIRYDLARQERVKLVVYDLHGREVAALVDETQSAGSHTVHFDGSNLASGVYLCRLSADDVSYTQKIVLLK